MFYILENEDRRIAVLKHIRMLSLFTPFSVEVKKYEKKRSVSQNRLYWSWIKILADYSGEPDDHMHKRMAVRFLGVEEYEIEGVKIVEPKSTAKLKTKEFTDYLTLIELTAHTLGISLPHPDDYGYAMGTERSKSSSDAARQGEDTTHLPLVAPVYVA